MCLNWFSSAKSIRSDFIAARASICSYSSSTAWSMCMESPLKACKISANNFSTSCRTFANRRIRFFLSSLNDMTGDFLADREDHEECEEDDEVSKTDDESINCVVVGHDINSLSPRVRCWVSRPQLLGVSVHCRRPSDMRGLRYVPATHLWRDECSDTPERMRQPVHQCH